MIRQLVCHDQNGGMGYVRYIQYLLSNDLSYTSIFFLYLITPSNSETFFFLEIIIYLVRRFQFNEFLGKVQYFFLIIHGIFMGFRFYIFLTRVHVFQQYLT